MDYVDHHKIILFFQHGFRAKHSCETQLINTIGDLVNRLDPKKTQPLMFPYTIRGQQLQHITHHPYHGNELADDLSWWPHLDKMSPKAQRTLNLLHQNLSDCPQNTKDVAYKTFVRPVPEYASTS